MGIIGGEVPRIISILKQFRGTMQGGHGIPVRCTIRVGPSKMSGRARRSYERDTVRVFSGFIPWLRRCLESKMGPQIPPASRVTKVWFLGVYNNAAECSFARIRGPSLGKIRSWRKTLSFLILTISLRNAVPISGGS